MAKISILIDNPESWFVPYRQKLAKQLRELGHEVIEVLNPQELSRGDIAFFLSCEQLVKRDLRGRNKHNIVIHASSLPLGKGWSPLAWQILEGKNEITLTMFEAVDDIDAGDVYATETIKFEGHELIDEMRQKEGEAIIRLALRFTESYPAVAGKVQEGKESFYPRRTPKDSELDPTRSIIEIFDKLRVADNERYPAFFTHRGHTYTIKIYKKGGSN